MKGYAKESYGDAVAAVYDRWVPASGDAVEFLAARAGQGPILELGVGTGRVALPLAARGLPVTGVDVSPAMLDRLRAKPGAEGVTVHVGDISTLDVPGGPFRLVYVIAATLYCLSTQDEQVRCVRRAAQLLDGAGTFVVEAFVPDPGRFDRGQRVEVRALEAESVRLDVARHDPVGQRVDSQQVVLTPEGIRLYPVRIRYIWPAELDLMARLAGLRLLHRYEGWDGRPFTAASRTHVSVYGF